MDIKDQCHLLQDSNHMVEIMTVAEMDLILGQIIIPNNIMDMTIVTIDITIKVWEVEEDRTLGRTIGLNLKQLQLLGEMIY